jgi:hypothetical protein
VEPITQLWLVARERHLFAAAAVRQRGSKPRRDRPESAPLLRWRAARARQTAISGSQNTSSGKFCLSMPRDWRPELRRPRRISSKYATGDVPAFRIGACAAAQQGSPFRRRFPGEPALRGVEPLCRCRGVDPEAALVDVENAGRQATGQWLRLQRIRYEPHFLHASPSDLHGSRAKRRVFWSSLIRVDPHHSSERQLRTVGLELEMSGHLLTGG